MSLPDSRSVDDPQGVLLQKPKANVYTAMLVLALLAMIVSCMWLLLELKRYDYKLKATSALTGDRGLVTEPLRMFAA